MVQSNLLVVCVAALFVGGLFVPVATAEDEAPVLQDEVKAVYDEVLADQADPDLNGPLPSHEQWTPVEQSNCRDDDIIFDEDGPHTIGIFCDIAVNLPGSGHQESAPGAGDAEQPFQDQDRAVFIAAASDASWPLPASFIISTHTDNFGTRGGELGTQPVTIGTVTGPLAGTIQGTFVGESLHDEDAAYELCATGVFASDPAADPPNFIGLPPCADGQSQDVPIGSLVAVVDAIIGNVFPVPNPTGDDVPPSITCVTCPAAMNLGQTETYIIDVDDETGEFNVAGGGPVTVTFTASYGDDSMSLTLDGDDRPADFDAESEDPDGRGVGRYQVTFTPAVTGHNGADGDGTHSLVFTADDGSDASDDTSHEVAVLVSDAVDPAASTITAPTFDAPVGVAPGGDFAIEYEVTERNEFTATAYIINRLTGASFECGSDAEPGARGNIEGTESRDVATTGTISCDTTNAIAANEGVYNLELVVTDEADNALGASIQAGSRQVKALFIDATDPQAPTGVTLTPTMGGGATLTWVDGDDVAGTVGVPSSGIDDTRYLVQAEVGGDGCDDDDPGSAEGTSGSSPVTVPSQTDGGYCAFVRHIDSAGNLGDWAKATVATLDGTAPALSASSILDGFDADGTPAFRSGDSVDVHVTVTDAGGVGQVRVLPGGLADAAELTHDADDIYTGSFVIGDVASGQHTIRFDAEDTLGNAAAAGQDLDLIVDDEAPSIDASSITYPGGASAADGVEDEVTISVNPAADDTGIASVQADLSAFGGAAAQTLSETEGVYTHAFTPVVGPGAYLIPITLTDGLGNAATVDLGELLQISSPFGDGQIAPLAVTYPGDLPAAKPGNAVGVSALISPADGALPAVAWTFDAASDSSFSDETVVDNEDGTFTASATVTVGETGSDNVVLTATAPNGDSGSVTALLNIDRVAPVLTSVDKPTQAEKVYIRTDGSGTAVLEITCTETNPAAFRGVVYDPDTEVHVAILQGDLEAGDCDGASNEITVNVPVVADDVTDPFALERQYIFRNSQVQDVFGDWSAENTDVHCGACVVVDNTVPLTPTGLVATPDGADVDLVWDDVGDAIVKESGVNIQSGLAAYEVLVTDDGCADGETTPHLLATVTEAAYTHSAPGQACSYVVRGIDNAGNIGGLSDVAAFDSGAPDVVAQATTYPGTQSVAQPGQDVTFAAQVIDPNGIDSVQIDLTRIGGTVVEMDLVGNAATHGVTLAGDLADGSFALPVVATDAFGTSSDPVDVTLIVDGTVPGVSITSPTTQQPLFLRSDGFLAVDVDVDDDNPAELVIELRDREKSAIAWRAAPLAVPTQGINSLDIDLADGTYLLQDPGAFEDKYYNIVATVTDGAGLQKAVLGVRAVVIDNTAPTAPASITVTPGANGAVTVSWPAADDLAGGSGPASGVAGYELFAKPSADAPIAPETDAAIAVSGLEHTFSPGSGDFIFGVRAVDEAGNDGSLSPTDTATLDRDLPTFSNPSVTLAGGQAAVASGQTVDVAIDIADASGDIAEAKVDVSALTGVAQQTVDLTLDAGDTWTATGITVGEGIVSGDVLLPVTAWDEVGNAATQDCVGAPAACLVVPVDNDAPDVSALTTIYPNTVNGARDGQTVTVRVTVTDAHDIDSVTADISSLTGQAGDTAVAMTGDGSTYSVDLVLDTAAATQSFRVPVTAQDEAGNTRDIVGDARPQVVVNNDAPTFVVQATVYPVDQTAAAAQDVVELRVTASHALGIDAVSVALDDGFHTADESVALALTEGVWSHTATIIDTPVDATYLLGVNVVSGVGTTATSSEDAERIELRVDATEPANLDITSPTQAGPLFIRPGGTIEVAIEYDEANPADVSVQVENPDRLDPIVSGVTIDNVVLAEGTDAVGTFDLTFPLSDVDETQHNLEVTLADGVGQVAVGRQPLSIIVDATAPSILPDDPDATIGADDDILFVADVSDGAFGEVASVTVDLFPVTGIADDVLQLTLDEGDRWEGTYSGAKKADLAGEVEVPVTAVDAAGNEAEDVFFVLFDTIDPALANGGVLYQTHPAPAFQQVAASAGQDVTIAIDASDNDGIASVRADLSALSLDGVQDMVDEQGTGTYSIVATLDRNDLATGTVEVPITVTDDTGNEQSDAVSVALDLDAPQTDSATVLQDNGDAPDAGGFNAGDLVRFDVTASDVDSGVKAVQVDVTSLNADVGRLDLTLDGAVWSGSVAITGQSSGEQTVTVLVFDGAGNEDASNELQVAVTNVAPTVVADAPTYSNGLAAGTDADTVSFRLTVTDDVPLPDGAVTMTLTAIGGGEDIAMTPEGDDVYVLNDVSLAGLADGIYDATFEVTDAGGETATGTIQVSVDSNAPVLAHEPIDDWFADGDVIAISLTSDDGEGTGLLAAEVDATALGAGTVDLQVQDATTATGDIQIVAAADGAQSITFTGTDAAGNAGTLTLDVNVDNNAPTVSLEGPTGDFTHGDQVAFVATASDAGSGVDGVAMDVSALTGIPSDVIAMNDNGDGTWGLTVTIGAVASGPASVVATAVDVVGNDASASADVSVDNDAPTVVLTVAAGPYKVGDTVAITATAADAESGVSSVVVDASALRADAAELALDYDEGQDLYTGSVVIDAEGTDHEATLTATATDGVGQTASDTASVDLDNAPPVITPDAVVGFFRAGDQVDFSAMVADDVGGAGLADISVDRSALTGMSADIVAMVLDEGAYVANALVGAIASGAPELVISATDLAGNTATATLAVSVDNDAPTVALTVSPGSFGNGDMLTFTAEVDDLGGSGLATVTLDASAVNPGVGTVTLTDAEEDGTFEGMVEVTTSGNGQVTFTATATDGAGNVGIGTDDAQEINLPQIALQEVVYPLYVPGIGSYRQSAVGPLQTVTVELCGSLPGGQGISAASWSAAWPDVDLTTEASPVAFSRALDGDDQPLFCADGVQEQWNAEILASNLAAFLDAGVLGPDLLQADLDITLSDGSAPPVAESVSTSIAYAAEGGAIAPVDVTGGAGDGRIVEYSVDGLPSVAVYNPLDGSLMARL